MEDLTRDLGSKVTTRGEEEDVDVDSEEEALEAALAGLEEM